MKKYRAGQTIYVVHRDRDTYSRILQNTYRIDKFFLQEKDPYVAGQVMDFRLPRGDLSVIQNMITHGIKMIITTSRRKAISHKKRLELLLRNSQ